MMNLAPAKGVDAEAENLPESEFFSVALNGLYGGYKGITEQLAAAEFEPDAEMPPEEFVNAVFSDDAAKYIHKFCTRMDLSQTNFKDGG